MKKNGLLHSEKTALAKTSSLPGIRTYINPQQSLRFGGRSSASQYQLVVQGLNADTTNEWSNKLMEAMRRDRTFAAVNSDAQNGAIAATISVDPEGGWKPPSASSSCQRRSHRERQESPPVRAKK